jgi:integrase
MGWERTKRPGIYKAATATGTRYKVYWRDAGGKQRTKTFRRWKDAEDFANGVGHRRAIGDLPDLERGRMTLRDLIAEVHAARSYAPSTLQVHAACMTKLDGLPDKELREITPEAVESTLEAIDKPVMRDKTRLFLSAMFSYALSKRCITTSPVRRPSASHTRADRMRRRESSNGTRKRYLNEEELARLVEATPARWRAMVALMARMGLPPGEAYALTVGKFVPATEVPRRRPPTLMVDTSITGFTKTGEARELVLPASVAEMLADHIATYTTGHPDAPMFTNERGRAIGGKNAADAWRRRHFTPAAEAAGINHGFTPNALRHSAASFAIQHGANVYHVQRMLGHAKPSITLDVYGELWDDSLGELAERLDVAIREATPTA